jgi:hypothetical protein
MTNDADPTPVPRPRRARRPSGVVQGAADAPDATPQASEVAPARAAIAGEVLQADRLEVRMGAVGRVDAATIEVEQGAIGAARADRITVDRGAIGAAMTGQIDARQSFVRSILAREARVEQSFVRTIVAAEVRIERATFVGILLTRRVVGDVRVLLDWRGALAFGAAAGLVAGLIGRIRRGRE